MFKKYWSQIPPEDTCGQKLPIGAELHSLLLPSILPPFPLVWSHTCTKIHRFNAYSRPPGWCVIVRGQAVTSHWHTTKLSWGSNFRRDCFRALNLCHGCMSFLRTGSTFNNWFPHHSYIFFFFAPTQPAGSKQNGYQVRPKYNKSLLTLINFAVLTIVSVGILRKTYHVFYSTLEITPAHQ